MSQDSQDGNRKLWGGRFSESTSALVEQFSESVSFDQRLYRHDIRGSQAHARMLERVGVLANGEAQIIVDGLDAILADIEAECIDDEDNDDCTLGKSHWNLFPTTNANKEVNNRI